MGAAARTAFLLATLVAVAPACKKPPPEREKERENERPKASAAPLPSPPVEKAAAPLDDAGAAELDGMEARLRKVLAPQIGPGRGKNQGVVVGLALHGQRRIFALGRARAEVDAAPDARTVFEIGSITKTFTALLLADAIERGVASEDARLDAIRPEWKTAAAGDVRLIDLVTHRSGLPRLPCNLRSPDPKRPYATYDEDDLVRGLSDASSASPFCRLSRHPTDTIEYSNWGFALLGFSLATLEKTPFMELLARRIAAPLGLSDTTYELSPDQRARLAQGYDDHGEPTPLWDRKAMLGNGAVRSTVTDVLTYGEAYLHPERSGDLAPALRRATRQVHEHGGSRIAYAWFRTKPGSLFHDGMTGGYASFIKVYPSRDLVIVFLTNTARDLDCFVDAVEDIACSPGSK